MRFKEFLNEASRVSWDPEKISDEQLLEFVKENCSKSLWRIREDDPIWRGDQNLSYEHVSFIDTRAKKRRSANSSNHYTLIFDNHPQMKDWPKRSESLICATNEGITSGYGYPFRVLPIDTVKHIAAVNERDIWDAKVEMFGRTKQLHSWNRTWNNLKIPDNSWEDFEEFFKRIDDDEGYELKVRRALIGDSIFLDDDDDGFEEIDGDDVRHEILNGYDPHNLGFTLHSLSEPLPERSELWFSGECLMIPSLQWEFLQLKIRTGS